MTRRRRSVGRPSVTEQREKKDKELSRKTQKERPFRGEDTKENKENVVY